MTVEALLFSGTLVNQLRCTVSSALGSDEGSAGRSDKISHWYAQEVS